MTYEYQLRPLDMAETTGTLQRYIDEATVESWEMYQMLPKLIVFRRDAPEEINKVAPKKKAAAKS